jgi:GT2 family glycosyltransferase
MSSPDHVAKLEQYSSDRVKLIRMDQNLGLGSTRNVGISAAQHEFVAFLDDDDTWLPDKLERQWRVIEGDSAIDGCTGALRVHHRDGRQEVWRHHTPEFHTLESTLVATPALSGTYLLRKSLLDRIGGFDPDFWYFEDWEFCIRLMKAGARIRHLSDPLLNYTFGGPNQATSRWYRHNRGRLQVIRRHADAYKAVFGTAGYYRMLATALRRAGLEKGGVVGRLVYALGCTTDPRFFGPLLTSGRMSQDGFEFQGVRSA